MASFSNLLALWTERSCHGGRPAAVVQSRQHRGEPGKVVMTEIATSHVAPPPSMTNRVLVLDSSICPRLQKIYQKESSRDKSCDKCSEMSCRTLTASPENGQIDWPWAVPDIWGKPSEQNRNQARGTRFESS